jgi:integrase
MRVISFQELETSLQAFLYRMQNKDVYAYDLATLLYYTGIRQEEAYNVSRWLQLDEFTARLQPQKGNNIRDIPKSNITQYFWNSIAAQTPTYQEIRYSTFARFIYHNYLLYPVYHDKKIITTHLFRHYRMKKLYNIGMSIADIASYFGEIDQGNIEDYVFSDLSVFS